MNALNLLNGFNQKNEKLLFRSFTLKTSEKMWEGYSDG